VLHAGGHTAGGRTNDLLMLDLSTATWSQPGTSGTAPSPRQGAAICVGNGRQLFVHGGRNSFLLEDLHCLDLLVGGSLQGHGWLCLRQGRCWPQ
jgi:hypothetical protein